MKVIHHNDLDGRCSAQILVEKFDLKPEDLIETDYSKNEEFSFSFVEPNEEVYIVDFSIEPEEMKRLLAKTKNVIWIDHHISAIKKYKEFDHEIAGIRKVGISACVLTYQYIYPEKEVPQHILYICDRDVWAFIYGDRTKNFFSGSNLYDTTPFSSFWDYVKVHTEKIIEAGKNIEQYKYQHNKEYLEKYGYYTEFEGYDAIVVNQGLCGSEVFDSLDELPPIQILYAENGEENLVSLRSTKIDVSKLASKYGGGGHKAAAGFSCQKLPWITMEDL